MSEPGKIINLPDTIYLNFFDEHLMDYEEIDFHTLYEVTWTADESAQIVSEKYVRSTILKSERLAHEETKAELVKYQDAFVRERERFEHEEHDHSLTEKRLEELEVAILNAQNADSYDFLMNLQDKIAKARSKS